MQVMGEPYPSAAWAHYYQAAGGTYVPWPPFPQVQGYFHAGVQQQHCYNTPQQPGYGFYQTQWNQTCQGFSQSATYQPVQQVQATPTSKNTARREDASSSNTESYEPMPMDISPSVSPVKARVAAKQEVSGIVPMATSGFTEPPADIKRLLLSSPTFERQASHTMKTLKVTKFQCPDPLNAQSSVFSLLEKCISCTKKILAVAKGEGKNTVTEPCTCKRTSAPCEILKTNSQSRGMTKEALEKSLGRPIAPAKGANVEHTFQTDSRTTRDFKQRCRSRWGPTTLSNSGHVPLDGLPATRSAMEPKRRKPIFISTLLQQAAYSGSQGPANNELPQSPRKVAVSKSAKIATGSAPTVPHREISPESDNPVKAAVQAASHKSGAESCTVDACVGEKVKGVYTPDSTIDTSQTTCINIKVDPKLGGCVEMRDGPVEFSSEVEEEDEGWVLSFD